MKVCVHNVAHRLVGQLFDLRNQSLRGGRLRMRVNHQHAVIEENDHGVAIDFVLRLSDCGIDAIGHGFDLE